MTSDESLAINDLYRKIDINPIILGIRYEVCPFAARFGDEATLIRLARAFEEAMPWDKRKPAVHISREWERRI